MKIDEALRLWWGRHKKMGLIVGAICGALIMIAVVLATMWIRLPDVPVVTPATTTTPEVEGETNQETPVISDATGLRRDGVYTFLLVGRDTLGGGLTDTMILITYDTVNTTVDAMSLPRDTMVNVSTSSKKLNAVYNYNKGSDPDTQQENGITALSEAVEGLTGIYPDFYVMVEWDAVGNMVDALGGIWFDVPYYMDYDDPEQNLYIHQAAGYRLLDGDDAMQVIRHRQNNDGSNSFGDVGRIQVQQDFLMAVAEQCLTPAILLKASSLIEIFLQQVSTDLTFGNLLALAQKAYGIDVEEDVNIATMPYELYYRYSSYVLPVQEELLETINDSLNPYTAEITADQLELLYLIDSAGRMGVTSGELADSSLSDPYVYTPAVTTEEEESEELEAEGETDTETEVDPFAQPDPELPEVSTEETETDIDTSTEGADIQEEPQPVVDDTVDDSTETTEPTTDTTQEGELSTENEEIQGDIPL